MGLLTRRNDWPERLAAVVDASMARPYKLGEWDCLRFACTAIEAMTGTDFWPRFAGYKTKRGAHKAMLSAGDTYAAAVGATLEVPEQSPLLARRGDLVMYRDLLDEDCLGVCIGGHVAVLAHDRLLRVPLTDARLSASWRVG
jgi:hypothetical protein